MNWISRVRVTGGFLEGLDIEFVPGLNVIVGPRGAGKTTILELLRHALALPQASGSRDRTSFLRHALGSGEIVLDISTPAGPERLVVDASGGGTRPGLTADIALMLGQNELEEIADSPARRLALIDIRAGIQPAAQHGVLEQLKRLTARAHDLRVRREELGDQLRQRTSLLSDRQRARDREAELTARSTASDLEPQRRRLASLEDALLKTQAEARAAASVGVAAEEIREWLTSLREISGRLRASADESSLAEQVGHLTDAVDKSMAQILEAADQLQQLSTRSGDMLRDEDVRLRAEAEPVRTSLDQLERGLGTVTAELRDLEVQIARLDNVERSVRELQREEEEILQERQTALELLEDASELVFARRDGAARSITEQLDHHVQITMRHLADTTTFRQVLAELLQGTGLKYNAVADAISATTLPNALLRYVEQDDVEGLGCSASLQTDRAARVVAALKNSDSLARLAGTTLSDAVDFRLQDGSAVKSVAQLSTGQKCAVTLPIVLTEPNRLVILDQPEDHLDNQFLVRHVVKSLVERTLVGAQSIVATHNPNIPVLGSAAQVVHLQSDGSLGSADVRGAFDSPGIVKVITELMEGGRQAFAMRAEFYAAHAGQ